MRANVSPGLDAWSVLEMQRLPTELWDALAAMLNNIELTGKWPAALMHCAVTLIPKEEGGEGDPSKPGRYRS